MFACDLACCEVACEAVAVALQHVGYSTDCDSRRKNDKVLSVCKGAGMSQVFREESRFMDSVFAILSLFGSACYLAVALLLVVNAETIELFSSDSSVGSCLHLATLAGLAIALLILGSMIPDKAADLVESKIAAILGFALMLPFLALAGLLTWTTLVPSALLLVLDGFFAALAGTGMAMMLAAYGNVWSKIYYTKDKIKAFCFIAAVAPTSIILFWTLGHLPVQIALALSVLLALTSSIVAVFLESNIKPFHRVEANESNERYPQYARRWLAPLNAGVAIGLLAFLVSLTFSLSVLFMVVVVGGIVGSAGIILYVVIRTHIPNLGDIDRVTIPAIGILFALLPLSQLISSGMQLVIFGILAADLVIYLITNWSNIALIHCKWQVNPVQNCLIIAAPIYLGIVIGGSVVTFLTLFQIPSSILFCVLSSIAVALVIVEPVRSAYADPDWEALYLFANDDERFGVDVWENSEAEAVRRKLESYSRQAQLTPRESEVLALLYRGKNANAIAELLFISPHTAKTHIYRIYQKAGVKTRKGLLDAISGCDHRSQE